MAGGLELSDPIRIMQTEIEAKFLNMNHGLIRARLQAAGAVMDQPMTLMRRTIFDHEDERLQKANSYIRVRDEGGKITVTFKKFEGGGIDAAKEISLIVDDYDAACNIFNAAGLTARARQESKRETWKLDEVEIMLDEWPWLKPYIEIEGPSQESIRVTAQKLGLSWDQASFGDVTNAYAAEYDIDVAQVGRSDFEFNKPIPEWLASKRRT